MEVNVANMTTNSTDKLRLFQKLKLLEYGEFNQILVQPSYLLAIVIRKCCKASFEHETSTFFERFGVSILSFFDDKSKYPCLDSSTNETYTYLEEFVKCFTRKYK